jgi:hypothetical protein
LFSPRAEARTPSLLAATSSRDSGECVTGPAPDLPANNPWNQAIDGAPVDPRSADIINFIGLDKGLHPDFGANWNGGPFGIPYIVVSGNQPKVPVTFDYDDESDPGPYPIPPNPPIEGGASSTGDRHVLIVDADRWILYELYARIRTGTGGAQDPAPSGT